MRTERSEPRSARIVGALYIAATAAGVSAAVAMGSLMGGPDVLAGLAANEGRVVATAFFLLLMALAVAGVAFMIHPVLRRDADTPIKQGLALWYVGTRITEGAMFLVSIVALFSLLALSRAAGPGSASAALATVLDTVYNYSFVLGQTVFCVGAAMLYYLLFVSKRVPRWLSVWGLIAAVMMLVGGFLLPFTGDPNSTAASILYAPMGLQEMVLAVWLIVRGFNPPAGG